MNAWDLQSVGRIIIIFDDDNNNNVIMMMMMIMMIMIMIICARDRECDGRATPISNLWDGLILIILTIIILSNNNNNNNKIKIKMQGISNLRREPEVALRAGMTV